MIPALLASRDSRFEAKGQFLMLFFVTQGGVRISHSADVPMNRSGTVSTRESWGEHTHSSVYKKYGPLWFAVVPPAVRCQITILWIKTPFS